MLPAWVKRATEELRESTQWSRHWEPEAWGPRVVVGVTEFVGDAGGGTQARCISIPSAQLMVTLVRTHVERRKRVDAIWSCCCCVDILQDVLAALGLQAASVTE